ncbi:hypothetical protein KFL_001730150 [Klebsormidium nitens]|uniref:Uncharacterized protein n=1 Tax=Klebsormidium nitens TaxID=105231 RepID=A0A1Y1I238_KLENI|nr:hypothetical protein KFL_001730150 [Klebsormidium nitens]|eukprot:GAQ84022.1 hypothetical protein KFL_001730150 [Klebsormidium nitens]
MEASLVAFAEVEAMLLKLRRQAAKLLRSKTEAEVVQQLQDALNVLQGVRSFSEKSPGPSYEETHYVSMSEKRGVKKRRLACAADGCTELPTYGWPIWKPETCPAHATVGMEEYVPKKRCGKGLLCTKHSSFGWPGHMQTCCKIHAAPGMENVISKRCTTDGCAKRPVFGWEKLKPVKCKAHAEPDMRDVMHSLCEEETCSRRPSFGRAGDLRPSRCKIHAEPGMEDIVTKRCNFGDCYRAPEFAFGRDCAQRCELHKEEGMVRKRKASGAAAKKDPGTAKKQRSGAVAQPQEALEMGEDADFAGPLELNEVADGVTM